MADILVHKEIRETKLQMEEGDKERTNATSGQMRRAHLAGDLDKGRTGSIRRTKWRLS
jgi:hypothetical protein